MSPAGDSLDDVMLELMRRWAQSRNAGETLTPEEICRNHPERLQEFLRRIGESSVPASRGDSPSESQIPYAEATGSSAMPPATGLAGRTRRIRCPHCHNPINLVDERSDEVLCPGCGSSFTVRDARHTDTTSRSRPLGKYQLLERVGLGAFGAVWKSRDTELDRIVALKIPHTGLLTDDTELERFKREARAAAQLRHPGIVTVHSVEMLEGLPTIVSDFIDGVPLRDLLQTRRLTFREAATLLADIAEAVHYAHSLGVVHRDLKPANIMVERIHDPSITTPDPSGSSFILHPSSFRPLVMDFGLALRGEAEMTMTIDGHIIGTPAYMSPEQAAGKGHQADARSDVYSLGVIFYELLTGELPFRGSRAMLRDQVLHEEPRPPRKIKDKIPRDLETVCLKCLRKESNRRYQSARELAVDLRRWLKGEPVQARPVGCLERGWRWCRRNPAFAGMAAAVVLALLAGTGVSAYFAIREAKAAVAEKIKADEAERARRESDSLRYISDMRLAQYAWEDNRFEHVRELLDRHHPEKTGADDIRGFEWHYWHKRLWAELPIQIVHPMQEPRFSWSPIIYGLAFSLDGRQLATASGDKSVRVWDIATGRELLVVNHPDWVRGVAFSPDGTRLATASDDHNVRVWDVSNGQEILVLKGHDRLVWSVAFSPDGRRVVSASGDDTARVWDTDSRQTIMVLKGHLDSILSVALDSEGRHVVTASADGTARVWDLASGKIVHVLTHGGWLWSVAVSRDGRRVVTGSEDGTARVWDAVSGKTIHILRGHGDPVRSVAFSMDGRIATRAADGTARIWDADTAQEILTLTGQPSATNAVAFSPDGRRLATASVHSVSLRDAIGGDVVHVLKGHTGSVCDLSLSPDGRRLATACDDPHDWKVHVYDFASGEELCRVEVALLVPAAVALSPDGSRLVAMSKLTTSGWVWDVSTGQKLFALDSSASSFEEDKPRILGVAYSPNGRFLAASDKGHIATVFDPATGKELLRLKGHTGRVARLAFSSDSRLLGTASEDHTARVWEASSGRELLKLIGHEGSVWGVSFSHDGRYVATASADRTARVWDAVNGEPVHVLRGHADVVWDVAYSPDGRRLVTVSDDKTARVWDTTTGQELLTLKGHTGAVCRTAFSPNGRRLATVSKDGTVRIWETDSISPHERRDRRLVRVVRTLWGEVLVRDELLSRIRVNKFLDEAERKQALAFAERYPEQGDSSKLNELSWWVASRKTGNAEHYQLAQRQAEAACRAEPEKGTYLNTLGVAQYRCEQYQDALKTLTRSEPLNAKDKVSRPEDLAFLAMTHHRLGNTDQAKTFLDRLRERMNQGEPSADAKAFLQEAKALIEGKMAPAGP